MAIAKWKEVEFMGLQRVVVTGIGAIHPFGFGWATLWENILANRSAIAPISRFDTDGLGCKVAAGVNGFDPLNFDLGRRMGQNDLCAQFAAAALKLALTDAALDLAEEDKNAIGIMMGCSCGGSATQENAMRKFFADGEKAVNPWSIPRIMGNSPASVSARQFGLGGPNLTINTACSSSLNAIGLAVDLIRSGSFPTMVAGGTEAPIVPHLVAGFGALGALAKEGGPDAVCRPFDARRQGFVLGEGSVLLVLESLEHAVNRGAAIYGEIAGFASFCDISHPVLPDMTGVEAARTMRSALARAGITPADVDYIHAHGTGTKAGDIMETRGIKLAFGEDAAKIPVSSSKGAVGHLLGGAGATGTVLALLALKNQLLPPTVNLEQPDPECDLDYIPGQPRVAKAEWALANSFGFGGNNSCLVLKRYQ
ncbi:MAG: beta-ketoacyl-[acyl-carrier-protein] synthase family protein [Negativicutes bacterium]|nr:beta-ketoacyl-[acyl-carrier-protein] synthase family protein [Negativicutes bacterium]